MSPSASSAVLALYHRWGRLSSRLFSLLVGGSFAAFGPRSVLSLPVRLHAVRGISIGADVFLAPGCWLQTLPGEHAEEPRLELGDGTSIAGLCVLSAALEIVLERRVLLARNVYIADHMHAFDDPTRAVLDQGITRVAPVRVGEGAWLGQNVVVCPGVTIGAGAVVGANSVVNRDVPAFSVAVGAPARVVRHFAPESR